MFREVNTPRRNRTGIVIVAAAIVACGTALAQENESIVVVAPHKVTHKTVGTTGTGVPIEEVSFSQTVGFADLDLGTPAGVAALRQRVTATANESCAQLDRIYPDEIDVALPFNKTCQQAAVAAAMPQVNAVIRTTRK
jgi:UrcA family protein